MLDEMMIPEKESRPEEDILLDLNFVPQWAKKAPATNHYAFDDRPERRSSSHDRKDGARRERSDRRDGSSRPARPPRERVANGRPDKEADQLSPRGSGAARVAPEPNREAAPRPSREPASRPERVELPIEVKFLPEQQWLASMVRQIHHSKRAFPLMDLASLFLSDPKGHLVKIEVLPGTQNFKLYQGRRSKIVSTSRDALIRQLLDEHFSEFFVKLDIEIEPPTGVFPMIGKIGDLLIGPPNHHSYTARMQEIYNSCFPGMPFERFRQKIETVRDEALVEKWKQEVSRKTVYRLVDAPEGEVRDFTFAQAADYIRTQIAEDEIEEVTRAVLPSVLARKISEYNLLRMVRDRPDRPGEDG
ncbi:MAG: hypothetical protein MUC65_04930 [Pontiellaceae bacterium]|nr:hypothetical protein [Pontiellaceae bacterium]